MKYFQLNCIYLNIDFPDYWYFWSFWKTGEVYSWVFILSEPLVKSAPGKPRTRLTYQSEAFALKLSRCKTHLHLAKAAQVDKFRLK